jgi:AraC-like DNA-binding protein
MFDPAGIVLLLLALLALVLAVVVLVGGETSRRRMLLAVLNVALAIYLIGAATMAGDAFTRFPHLARIGEPFLLLIPVLVYAYVKEFLGGGLQRTDAFHLLPFVVYLGLNAPFYMLSAVDKIRVFDQMVSSELTSTGGVILLLVRLVVVGGYSVAAMRLAENWQGKARRVASDPAMLFSWVMSGMRQVMWALVIMTAVALLLSVGVISSIQYGWLSALTFGVAWLVFGWEAYLRMGQIAPDWILESEKAPHVEAEAWPPIDDGDDVTCTPADEGFIWENPTRAVVTPLELIQQRWHLLLDETMTKGEWWREPSLTINDLAQYVGLPQAMLARLIEDRERCSFFEYVNRIRVDQVKKYITAHKSVDVDYAALAKESGFTSRRMMNRVFVRLTGSSPKTYKRLAAVTMINNNYQ